MYLCMMYVSVCVYRLRGLVSGQPNLAGLLAGVSVAAVVLAGEVSRRAWTGVRTVCLPWMSALDVCLRCVP